MNFELSVQKLETRISQVCHSQARYRVLWVIGPPRSGKTSICRFVCQHSGWKYVNYTLDPGFLDRLIGNEETYRPEDFLEFLRLLCINIIEEVIVIDEIEPLLSLWSWEQREVFFRHVGHAPRLETGVVIATRLPSSQELIRVVPGVEHIFEIPRGEKKW